MFCELERWDSLKYLKICEVKKKKRSLKALYRGGEMSGSTPAQNSRKNINHWIGASPLDARNIKPLEQLMMPHGLRSVSSNHGTHKTVISHV